MGAYDSYEMLINLTHISYSLSSCLFPPSLSNLPDSHFPIIPLSPFNFIGNLSDSEIFLLPLQSESEHSNDNEEDNNAQRAAGGDRPQSLQGYRSEPCATHDCR